MRSGGQQTGTDGGRSVSFFLYTYIIILHTNSSEYPNIQILYGVNKNLDDPRLILLCPRIPRAL